VSQSPHLCQRIAPPRQSRQANAPLLHSSQPLASPVPRSTSRGSPSRVRFPPRLPGRLRGNTCRRTSGQIAGRPPRQTAPQPRHEQPADNVCPVARPNGEQRHGPAGGFACRDTAGIRGASTTEHAIARQSLGQRKRTAAVSQRNRHRQPTVTGRKRVRTKLQPSAGRDAAESRLRRRSHTAEHHALEEVSGTTACQGSYSGTPAIVEHPTPFSIGHLGPVRPRDAVSARKTVGPDPRAAWRLPQCKRHTCRPKTRGSQGGLNSMSEFKAYS